MRYRLKARRMRKPWIPVFLFVAAACIEVSPILAAPFALQMPTSIARPSRPPAPQPAKSASKPSQAGPKSTSALLPASFAGWESSGLKPTADVAQVDPASVAALKEYGFTDAVLSDYTRDGETLKIKALRFADASGAYGAYTFYRQSGWPREEIGTGAASDHNRVLFWKGNVVVDATFPHVSAMSGSELRELASQIPIPADNKSLAPPILAALPQKYIDAQTTHYALGPSGYVGSGGVLPPDLVSFERGAETVTSEYKLVSGPATLTIINYPTPQMAVAQEKAIAAYLKAGNSPQHPFTKPLQDSNQSALEVKRSGPLVAIVSGDPIQDDAHKLLASFHYEANLASSFSGSGDTEVQKTAKLVVAIITLVAVMFLAALLLALFLGGGRAMYRLMRGKPISAVYDEEFTKLGLSD
jgi:hypothetical protein